MCKGQKKGAACLFFSLSNADIKTEETLRHGTRILNQMKGVGKRDVEGGGKQRERELKHKSIP